MKEAYEFHEKYKFPEWDKFYISIPKLVVAMKPLEKNIWNIYIKQEILK